jgi:hypothetical protein
VTKTNALESLVIASFAHGLPVRDVEATLAEALGDQAAISKSTVSAVCGHIKDEYEAWAQRRLDDVTLDYLFLDASFFRMHPGSPAEPVLAAWGITAKVKPVTLTSDAPIAGVRRRLGPFGEVSERQVRLMLAGEPATCWACIQTQTLRAGHGTCGSGRWSLSRSKPGPSAWPHSRN